mgnify:CR=1 FL=1
MPTTAPPPHPDDLLWVNSVQRDVRLPGEEGRTKKTKKTMKNKASVHVNRHGSISVRFGDGAAPAQSPNARLLSSLLG